MLSHFTNIKKTKLIDKIHGRLWHKGCLCLLNMQTQLTAVFNKKIINNTLWLMYYEVQLKLLYSVHLNLVYPADRVKGAGGNNMRDRATIKRLNMYRQKQRW